MRGRETVTSSSPAACPAASSRVSAQLLSPSAAVALWSVGDRVRGDEGGVVEADDGRSVGMESPGAPPVGRHQRRGGVVVAEDGGGALGPVKEPAGDGGDAVGSNSPTTTSDSSTAIGTPECLGKSDARAPQCFRCRRARVADAAVAQADEGDGVVGALARQGQRRAPRTRSATPLSTTTSSICSNLRRRRGGTWRR